MLEINKVYCGDNIKLIKELNNECIDLSIQSPPYDSIRQYSNGYSFDFLNLVKELFRATKRGGCRSLGCRRRHNRRKRNGNKF